MPLDNTLNDENERLRRRIEQLENENQSLQNLVRKTRHEYKQMRKHALDLRAQMETDRQTLYILEGNNPDITTRLNEVLTELNKNVRYLDDQLTRERKEITRGVHTAQEGLREAHRATDGLAQWFNSVVAEHGAPQMVNLINQAVHEIEAPLIQTLDQVNAILGLEIDPISEPAKCILYIHHYNKLAGAYDALRNLLRISAGYLHDPSTIADEILRECRIAPYKPTAKTVNRMPHSWLEVNLPGVKVNTLIEGLTIVQQYKGSGKKQKEFCEKLSLEDRTLRKYMGWYELLEQTARATPTAHQVVSDALGLSSGDDQ